MPRTSRIDSYGQVKRAYLILKREVYAQKHNLRLRQRLADFESDQAFEAKLLEVHEVAIASNPREHPAMVEWLRKIDYVLLPKSVLPSSLQKKRRERFFSNQVTDDSYQTSKVNYFFDGPIELHILSILWVLFEGKHLDASLSQECVGTRLNSCVHKPQPEIRRLFRSYAPQYAKWRDGAIRTARRLLIEENRDVCILSLDFEAFFYRIQPDFKEIAQFIRDAQLAGTSLSENPFGPLLPIVELICLRYREVCGPGFSITHNIEGSTTGIPIEICFSPILANWCVRQFDDLIMRKVKPYYYARYVDDLLLVLPVFGINDNDPLEGVMRSQFVDTQVLRKIDAAYEVKVCEGIRLQKEKCILHHFDAGNSAAGLENFAKRIRDLSSEFRQLPDEEVTRPFKEVAWELLYDGSEFKWRNMIGIGEDKNELARFLHKSCILSLFADPESPFDAATDLEAFFKGTNGLQYYDLWERLFTLLLLTNQTSAARAIQRNLSTAIASLRFSPVGNHRPHRLSSQLQKALDHHLLLCQAMAVAAAGGSQDIDVNTEIASIARHLRNARLARHYFSKSEYEQTVGTSTGGLMNDQEVLNASPRFVPLEELMIDALARNMGAIDSVREFETAKRGFQTSNGVRLSEIEVKLEEGE